MKRYRILILFVTGLCFGLNTQLGATAGTLFTQGNQAFLKGDYKLAATTYEEVLKSLQVKSPELYYNLGNCYFKLTDFPNAILNYERALKLNPHDEDVRFNLRLANQRIEDKIEPVPELFYYRWFKWLRGIMTSGAWAVWALVFIGLATLGIYLFVLGERVLHKAIGFYAAILLSGMGLLCFFMGWSRYNATYAQNEAIVFSGSVSVKSAPVENSTGLFLLHSGSKVKIYDTLDAWVKVRTFDGNEGWILKSDIEII